MNKRFTRLLKMTMIGTVITIASASFAQPVSVRDINTYLKKRDDGKNVSLFHRFEVGYSFLFGNGSESSYMRYREQGNPNVINGITTGQSFSYRGFNGYAGVYFPMAYLSSNTALLLNTSLIANINKFELGNTSLDPSVQMTNEGADALIGIPIGLDFAYGGEVTNNKIDKVTLRAGAGVMPYLNYGTMADNSNHYARLGLRPYVKAEMGFFLGVEWKLRGMVIAGSRTIYNYTVGDYYLNDSGYYGSYSLKVSPSYVVGFSVFPFSFGWENDKW